MNDEVVLSMQNISKSFSGTKVLDKVEFNLRKGEVHVLIGENGAGKSTLMKILTGVHQKDEGEILLRNEENDQLESVEIKTPNAALNLGINMVFQETNLIEDMTIVENIFIGNEFTKYSFVDKQTMYNKTLELLERVTLDVSPNTLVRNLTVAQRQSVEIAKSLSHHGRIIILDEPTSSLSEREVRTLFTLIEHLKKNGVSIVYISHRMEELFEIGDRITVLRDGSFIDTVNVRETTEEGLINLMIGRKLDNFQYESKERINHSKIALECSDVSIENYDSKINLKVHSGEIVGMYGLVGAGRTEFAKAIYGIDKIKNGSMKINGKQISIKSPNQALKNGIGMLPEDRKNHGFIPNQSIRDNIGLISLKKLPFFIPSLKEEKRIADKYMKELSIAAVDINQSVTSLSGGNQQKVVFGKMLAMSPDILILDEPTRGVDVGAKSEIYEIILELANAGKAILMISSDLPELLRISDRILVMREGNITFNEKNENLSQDRILEAALN